MTGELFVAYARPDKPDPTVALRTPKDRRRWMDHHTAHWAYRCLPLRMANQLGVELALREDVVAHWDGHSYHPESVTVLRGERAASARFPGAVLTFDVPFVVVTPPEMNLLVLPPMNSFTDGAQAMTGLIETDWLNFTFTVNYKFTRPGEVRFASGTAIATLLPYPRAELVGGGSWSAHPLVEAPDDVQLQYKRYAQQRRAANARQAAGATPAEVLMLSYYRGENMNGDKVAGHMKSLARCPHQFPPE
ncbi:DUF6065 family protein [Deinococcus sp. SM5_A1]|uniref:DUF6065 family protein n=1 Tax=Deinococcus sp. SM5_A1 TaxID=3379094 RepID=UPI00385F57D1